MSSSIKLIVLGLIVLGLVLSARYLSPQVIDEAKNERQAIGREMADQLQQVGD